MKKSYNINFLFTIILSAIFAAAFVLSCASKKTITSKQIETLVVDAKEKSKSTEVSSTNDAINDTIKYFVGKLNTNNKVCDSLAAIALNDYFKNYNYAKISGNNEWSIKYDQLKRQLVVINKQAKTQNKTTTDTLIKTKFVYKNNDVLVSVPVKYVPVYMQYLAGFGALVLLALVIYTSIKFRNKFTV